MIMESGIYPFPVDMQVWIEYDGVKKKIDVTLAPISVGFSDKPTQPLLSLTRDLSPILNNRM